MFLIFEIMIEILVELYTSLNFGTSESKVKRKVKKMIEKLGEDYPEILDAYEKHQTIFEKDIELNKAILELNLKDQAQTKHVAKLIQTNITRIEASSKKF